MIPEQYLNFRAILKILEIFEVYNLLILNVFCNCAKKSQIYLHFP